MLLDTYIKNGNVCPICNTNLACCFSHKSKKLRQIDGYLEVEFDLLKSFNDKTLHDYSYKYKFHPDSYHFLVDFYQEDRLLDNIPLKIFNLFHKRKVKDIWVYKHCPKLCCAVNSNFVDMDFESGTINPLHINSYTLDLSPAHCLKYNLPFDSCKMYSSSNNNYTFINSYCGDKNSQLEYHYYINFDKVDNYLHKLHSYLLLS